MAATGKNVARDERPLAVRMAHAPDEEVLVSEVLDCARVLAVWLLRELGAS